MDTCNSTGREDLKNIFGNIIRSVVLCIGDQKMKMLGELLIFLNLYSCDLKVHFKIYMICGELYLDILVMQFFFSTFVIIF